MLYQIAPARNVNMRLQYTTPIHKAIDTAATIFALADVLSPAPTPSTCRLSPVAKYRTSFRPISTRNRIFAAYATLTGGPIVLAGSIRDSAYPDTAVTRNDTNAHGIRRCSGRSGSPFATPRIRRSISPTMPTRPATAK